jgi:23S rRNA (adenine2503-C2)-methyltransferase
MMDGVNDTEDQAFKLAAIARRLHAHVNLIALNPTPLTAEKASSESRINEFARILKGEKVNVTIRDTRGQDIDAACGQLRVIARGPSQNRETPSPSFTDRPSNSRKSD